MITDLWYKNAIVYCLSVDSYMDSNGDGLGDFEGLTRRLDYLQGFGVTTLWLMPFQTSPRRDHGYDVSDYYNVDSRFGTLGDFVEFTHSAEQRGMRVLIDLVVNHTSDQHPWFRSERARRTRTRRLPRLVHLVEASAPPISTTASSFPACRSPPGPSTRRRAYWYFHRFYEFQPDLNTMNPEVQRRDPQDHGLLDRSSASRDFASTPCPSSSRDTDAGARPSRSSRVRPAARASASCCNGARATPSCSAEANVPPKDDMKYFGDDGDRLHMMFNFQVNQTLFYALASADTRPLVKALEATKPRSGRPRNGACSCATTTSSTSGG